MGYNYNPDPDRKEILIYGDGPDKSIFYSVDSEGRDVIYTTPYTNTIIKDIKLVNTTASFMPVAEQNYYEFYNMELEITIENPNQYADGSPVESGLLINGTYSGKIYNNIVTGNQLINTDLKIADAVGCLVTNNNIQNGQLIDLR